MSDILLEAIVEQPILSQTKNKNKREQRKALLGTSVLILMLPFAISFAWYGFGLIYPTMSVMPTTGVGISCGQYIYFTLFLGHPPTFNDYVNSLVQMGIVYSVATVIAAGLVALGWAEMAALTAFLSATGVGIAVASTIIGL